MTRDQRSRLVKQLGMRLGFNEVGIAPAAAPPSAACLPQWLDRGYAGRMSYLHRHIETLADPQRLLPEARAVIVVALAYPPPPPPTTTTPASPEPVGRFASYAWGDDYHRVVRRRLDQMVAELHRELDDPFAARPFVDTAPILEKPLAAAAGLGWIGNHSLLVTPHAGSFVYLGGLAITTDLLPDEPVADRCGTCRRCIEACPTRAIVEPRVVDSRRCISYLTIEHREAIPSELRPSMGNWVFGCDVCQQVCPHNRRNLRPYLPELSARPPAPTAPLHTLLNWKHEDYLLATRGRAIRRAKCPMLRRNAAVALGNIGNAGSLPLLEQVADENDPLVGEHARWAIERIRHRGDDTGSTAAPHPGEQNG